MITMDIINNIKDLKRVQGLSYASKLKKLLDVHTIPLKNMKKWRI